MEPLQLSRLLIGGIIIILLITGVCFFAWGRPKEGLTGDKLKYAKWTSYGTMVGLALILVASLWLFKSTGDISEQRMRPA